MYSVILFAIAGCCWPKWEMEAPQKGPVLALDSLQSVEHRWKKCCWVHGSNICKTSCYDKHISAPSRCIFLWNQDAQKSHLPGARLHEWACLSIGLCYGFRMLFTNVAVVLLRETVVELEDTVLELGLLYTSTVRPEDFTLKIETAVGLPKSCKCSQFEVHFLCEMRPMLCWFYFLQSGQLCDSKQVSLRLI